MQFLSSKRFFTLIVLLGLIGVCISYYLSVKSMSGDISALWGNMPESMHIIYYISTFLAFMGFAILFCFLVFKTDLVNYYPFSRSAIVILIAAMLWLPYTADMIAVPDSFTWIKIRISLLLVGLGAWFMLRRVWQIHPDGRPTWKRAASIGAAMFFFHTMIMDAILWPYLFR